MADAVGVEQELRLSGRDGLTLVGSEWAPEPPVRGVLVVVHGLKDHIRRYTALVNRLNPRGVAVVGLDLRGHGRSEGRRAWVRRFEEYVADLDIVWEHAGRRHPGAPRFLLGHSMGGAIVARFVLERAPEVAGAVLSAPALQRPETVSGAAVGLTKLLSRLAPRAGIFRLPNEDFSRDPAVVRGMAEDPLIYQRPAPARTAAELLATMDLVRARTPEFRAPVLALHGTLDRLTNPAGSRAFIERAGAPSKSFRSYPGLFHDLLHEPERSQVLDDVTGWVLDRAA